MPVTPPPPEFRRLPSVSGFMRSRGIGAACVAALVAMAALPLVAAPAHAQSTPLTLVSNAGEDTPSSGNPFTAQSFTTGSAGATISEIQVKLSGNSGEASVGLREDKTTGCRPTTIGNCPGDPVATFGNPPSISAGINTFTAPADTTLEASTTYWVMIHEGVSGTRRNIPTTTSNDETGATNWTIGDSRLVRTSKSGNWFSESSSISMAIKGTLIAPTFSSAKVDGTALSIKFSEDLDAMSVPAVGDFAVTVAGSARAVAAGGVAVADAKVTLTLASAVKSGQEVKVSYTKPAAMPLQNGAGVAVETFGFQSVDNTTSPLITGMALVSKPRLAHGTPAIKKYGAGQAIVVAVTWDDEVSWDLSANNNAEIRVRLQIGSGTKTAKLVTDGASSGTAQTLWFAYEVVSGDSDTDGVAVVPTTMGGNAGKAVFLHSGAKLKNAEEHNAKLIYAAGVAADMDHQVIGSQSSPGNSAPTYDTDNDPMTDNTNLGTVNLPSTTLITDLTTIPIFADRDNDNLRFTTAATHPDALAQLEIELDFVGADMGLYDIWRLGSADDCVLDDLFPDEADDQIASAATLTAHDPDGDSVTVTRTLTVTWVCREFVSAAVTGAALTLTYDSSLPPQASHSWRQALGRDQFVVKVDGAEVELAAAEPAVSGATITLTLATAVGPSQTDIMVTYKPAGTQLLRGVTDEPVNNTLATTPVSATVTRNVSGTTLTLTFDKDLRAPSAAVLADLHYTFIVSGLYWRENIPLERVSPESAAVSGKTVTMIFGQHVWPGRDVTLDYSPRKRDLTNLIVGLQNTVGNKVAGFSGYEVTNSMPAAAPRLVSGQVTGTALTLTFDQDLDATATPPGSRFSVTAWNSGVPRTVLGTGTSAVSGKQVTVTLASPGVAQGESATVWYTPGTGAGAVNLQAAATGTTEAIAIWGSLVKASMTASGDAGGDSGGVGGRSGGADGLSLGFGRSMNRLRVPSPDGFTVTSRTPGGAAAAPVAVSETEFSSDGTQLRLGLSRRLAAGERVTVSYSAPRTGTALWDSDGNQVGSFSAEAVVPSAPTVTGVEVVSDAGADGTYAMGEVLSFRVTFSEPVEVSGTPLLGIDMDPAHWGRKDAVYTGGSGTTELTFTHEVIWPNYSSQGIAVLANTLALANGTIRSASSQTDADLAHVGLGHDPAHKVDWRQSPPDANGNRPPFFGGVSQRHDNALPGYLVTLALSKDDFTDPDGDALTFTLSASRGDVHVPDGFGYIEGFGRMWFQAKTACALAALDAPSGDAHHTVITLTATDPDGATAEATATFRTNPTEFACPSLSSAAVDGATLTITLAADAALPPSYEQPTAEEFEVTVDGTAVSLAETDAVSASDTIITLALAQPVSASQTVTISYIPADNPMAAAFTDQPVTNNTPVPEKLTALEEPAAHEENAAPEATMPTSATVSGNELTLTFNRDLAAIDDTTAATLRWAFLVDGAFHHGTAITNQSPSRVVVDGATVTFALGTAILPGDDATVAYFAKAARNSLQDTDGNPVADFTATLATTARN